MTPVSIADFRAAARRRVPHFLFEYVDGGANDEVTLRANRDALQRIALRQRVLSGVESPSLATTLFGRPLTMPIVLAPVGLAGMYARRGEIQAARAAQAAGIPFTLSTVSVCPLDEVPPPFWFQLYMIRDRGFMRELLARATAIGCDTLVFTVDMPVAGTRYRDYRSGLAGAPGWRGTLRRTLQAATRPGWAWDVGVRGRPHHLGNIAPVLAGRTGLEDFFAWMGGNFDSRVTWRDLEAVRAGWPGTLVVKGILDVDDAHAAAGAGADGIVVSNHGGRQLDGALATAVALPQVAAAVGDRLTVLADGGVRSGLDVLRMLALGARGALLGRAWIYALAAAGGTGVTRMLDILAAELRTAMTLTGQRDIAAIDASVLATPPPR